MRACIRDDAARFTLGAPLPARGEGQGEGRATVPARAAATRPRGVSPVGDPLASCGDGRRAGQQESAAMVAIGGAGPFVRGPRAERRRRTHRPVPDSRRQGRGAGAGRESVSVVALPTDSPQTGLTDGSRAFDRRGICWHESPPSQIVAAPPDAEATRETSRELDLVTTVFRADRQRLSIAAASRCDPDRTKADTASGSAGSPCAVVLLIRLHWIRVRQPNVLAFSCGRPTDRREGGRPSAATPGWAAFRRRRSSPRPAARPLGRDS